MLERAFNIANIAGIPVRVHWTFGFFFIWIAFMGTRIGMDIPAIVNLCLFAMVLFICVVMHEFGHALTARRYGVTTKDIIISPIGGIARLLNIPEKPKHELIIALAGPMVNFIIATLIGSGLLLFTSQGLNIIGEESTVFNFLSNFLPALFWLNVILILFNLIPAFPMDGGRVLRSLLSMRLGRVKATQYASFMGQLLSIAFFIYGIYRSDFILSFIGVFVFFSASSEFKMVKADSILKSGTVSDVFRPHFTPIRITETMSKPINLLQEGVEKDFIILDEWDGIRGVLHEEFIREALKRKDFSAPVSAYASQKFEPVSLSLGLNHVFYIFQQKGYSIIPVYNIGQMIGVLDRRSLNNYLKLKTSIWNSWRSNR